MYSVAVISLVYVTYQVVSIQGSRQGTRTCLHERIYRRRRLLIISNALARLKAGWRGVGWGCWWTEPPPHCGTTSCRNRHLSIFFQVLLLLLSASAQLDPCRCYLSPHLRALCRDQSLAPDSTAVFCTKNKHLCCN